MLAWHVPSLGWRRLPADLSEFEIAHFITLKPVDIRAVRSRYKESLRLGAALQLGFLTMCGRPLSALQRVPTELLQRPSSAMYWRSSNGKSRLRRELSGQRRCRNQSTDLT
jgi:hypothetical protein